MSDDLITTPAHIVMTLSTGARITGRMVEYSDPESMHRYDVFQMKNAEGRRHFAHAGAIVQLSVFPLTVTPPPSDD